MVHVCIWGNAAWEIYGAIALFLCTLAMPFFPFFAHARRGVTPCFFGREWDTAWAPSEALGAPAARLELLVFSHWIIVGSCDSVSPFAGMTSAPPVPRKQMLFSCSCKAVVGGTEASINLSLTLYWERIPCTLWFCGEPDRCCCFGPKAPTLPGISPSVLRTWTRWDTAITFYYIDEKPEFDCSVLE